MTNNEAKNILENVWDFATSEDEEKADVLEKAIDMATISLNTIEKIKEIITEMEHYHVTTDRPNKADYDSVASNKFDRICKVIAEMKNQ